MLKGLNPGRPDIRLTVEQPTRTNNSIGEKETTWSVYKKMYASRGWKQTGEQFEAKEEVGTDNIQYVVRFDSGITSTMRLKQEQETTYFYIRSVQHWKREGYSQIDAVRRDDQ